MTTTVNLTKTGMGIEEGTVARWLKSAGDRVQQGEAIAEIESAKAMEELQAPVTGTLVRILVEAGQTAAVNTTLAEIEEDRALG